jgi:hypothetical protein
MRKSHHAQIRHHRTMKTYSHYRRLLLKKANHPHFLRRRQRRRFSPSDWYHQRRQAGQHISCASHGAFVLLDNVYKGDAIRHWLSHRKCGNNILASLNEIRKASDSLCPYCSELTDPTRFGDIRALQSYLLFRSCNNTYLYADREIGRTMDNDYYRYRCLIHATEYQATLQTVLAEIDTTRGCRNCGYDPTTLYGCW